MTSLFADDGNRVEREKVKRQEREGLNPRRETPEKGVEMGWTRSPSGGVSHQGKQGHFALVLLLCQLREARTSSVSAGLVVRCACRLVAVKELFWKVGM